MKAKKGGPTKSPRAKAAGTPGEPKVKRVVFEWPATGAFTVSVAANFNKWDPQAHPLRREKSGVWRVAIPLKAGRYEYLFVVDGVWRVDPYNPNQVTNPYGGFNSVREVA